MSAGQPAEQTMNCCQALKLGGYADEEGYI